MGLNLSESDWFLSSQTELCSVQCNFCDDAGSFQAPVTAWAAVQLLQQEKRYLKILFLLLESLSPFFFLSFCKTFS